MAKAGESAQKGGPGPQRTSHKKMIRLPDNARVTKRPLHRPALASPYANSAQSKIVYVSSSTSFLSAVKRVEKLLQLADKRLVQSATTRAKKADQTRGYKRRGPERDQDEVLGIAEEVEKLKDEAKRRRRTQGSENGPKEEDLVAGEEVLLKGTGRAIAKVLDMAGWFQQRGDIYTVRLRTGSVSAVDDITVDEKEEENAQDAANQGSEKMDIEDNAAVPETRIRKLSVLEVAVSLK